MAIPNLKSFPPQGKIKHFQISTTMTFLLSLNDGSLNDGSRPIAFTFFFACWKENRDSERAARED